jgi:hypothetical protein
MKRNRNSAFSLAAALALSAALFAGYSPRASARNPAQNAAQNAPDAPSEKLIKTRFEVLHMMYQAIQVRSVTDMREIHTFTYSPELRSQMQEVFNSGGYRYGDKIVVWYKRGGDVAFKIKGRPSKPN